MSSRSKKIFIELSRSTSSSASKGAWGASLWLPLWRLWPCNIMDQMGVQLTPLTTSQSNGVIQHAQGVRCV